MHIRKPVIAKFAAILFVVTLLTNLSLTPGTAASQDLTFTPQADAYVNSSSPSTNFGTGTTLRVDGSPMVTSYLRFTVSGLGGKTVTQAQLRIYANSASTSGLVVRSVTDNSWDETTIAYANSPSQGTTLFTSSAVNPGTWITLDVSSYIKSQGTFSFAISTPGATALSLATRESGADAPQLVITVIDAGTATPTKVKTATPTATKTSTPSPTQGIVNHTYYVSPSGNDGNIGSLAKPWKTIQKAAKTLVGGDKVYIRAGVYHETVKLLTSGTSTKPIQVMAYTGETPIIDGDNYALPTNPAGSALLLLAGDYVQVSGLEVRYSSNAGVILTGAHDTVTGLNVHHNQRSGIIVAGASDVCQNSTVWQNSQVNNGGTASHWSTGLSADSLASNTLLQGNTVYNNWGQGLGAYTAGATIQDNKIYDNWITNVYISNATNILLQRNLIYTTPNSIMTNAVPAGIMLGDERTANPSDHLTIVNNLLYGNNRNLYWWAGANNHMSNTLIAFNTFVNARLNFGIQINDGPHVNTRFMDNIILQEGSLPVAYAHAKSGLTFSYNLWSKTPNYPVSGTGDVIGDPLLTRTGDFTSANWYRLQASSPAIKQGVSISGISSDFFGALRSATPDLGAIQVP